MNCSIIISNPTFVKGNYFNFCRDDSGSTACPSLPEKNVNLQIANNLKSLLEEDTAYVLMTRSDDSTLSNNDRYTYANSTEKLRWTKTAGTRYF